MWILNQDRTRLSNIDTCCGISIDGERICVEYGDTDGYFVLGDYECPKEAKRIYSRIMEWVSDPGVRAVFHMPQPGGIC